MVKMLFLFPWRSAAVAQKETTSIFPSKPALSEKSNDSGEYKLSFSVQPGLFSDMICLSVWW